VDIVSPNRYLAQRDTRKYASFFNEFNFTTSHICLDEPEERHFRAHVLYGTNYDFEFAFMRDQLRGKPQRTWVKGSHIVSRPYDIVIVDEVDNLFIDSALQSARIALPSLKTMAWMYSPILAFAEAHKETIKNGLKLLSNEDEIFSDMIKQLRIELKTLQNGRYQKEVEEFGDLQLKTWLMNAYQAQHVLKEHNDYVIKHKKSNTPGLKDSLQITIVDRNNTGRLKEKSRWEGGLHQFIEAKHGLDIQEESLTVASLCHPVYFGYYRKIFGLTGTLGSEIERREVELTYSIDSFDVPPHQKCLRQQLDPLLAHSQEEQFPLIFKEIQEIQQNNRPILILCETIQKSNDLAKYLDLNKIFCQILNEVQAEQEDFIVARAGEPRMVTIATNTGGRGTDIILHPISRENGGLHVVFTFFAENERTEEQGFGRGGRQGQKGTCRFILLTDKNLNLLLEERKKSVEQASSSRIRSIEKAKMHHHFLANFWSQLREFYNISAEQLDLHSVSKWLQLVETQNPLFQKRLSEIGELVRVTHDPYQEKTAIPKFMKEIQSSLGLIAQQAWAHFFYGKLDSLDGRLAVQESYDSTRLFWENIFRIPKGGL
jgi:preprotein translocase subunit SecA